MYYSIFFWFVYSVIDAEIFLWCICNIIHVVMNLPVLQLPISYNLLPILNVRRNAKKGIPQKFDFSNSSVIKVCKYIYCRISHYIYTNTQYIQVSTISINRSYCWHPGRLKKPKYLAKTFVRVIERNYFLLRVKKHQTILLGGYTSS